MGRCFETLTTKETDVKDQAWEDLKNKSLVLPTESWVKIKNYILESCKQFNNCVDVQKKIDQMGLNNAASTP